MREPRFRVGVFCGSLRGADPHYMQMATEFGAALARNKAELVYGGGSAGLMGAVAAAARTGRAPVIGVTPGELFDVEQSDVESGELIVVPSMHERKAKMYELSDAFAVLPGGFGTLDELMEIVTWRRLGLHQKPVVVVNVRGFFDVLTDFLSVAAKEGFLDSSYKESIQIAGGVDEAFDMLLALRA
ncbi:TIGR00730 family Rossman fold protein [Streptomyces sp. NPDC048297]|uniref:LOG family protein n=1 Tax=Streptomyces sp. NPDC048297 TaxID=3365531 RepID=UPI00371C5789